MPIQKIFFGSPGTGKSFRIDKEVIPNKLKIHDNHNIIKTVFHPEYTYGDFMGKLMPLTDDTQKVSYRYYTGHFLKALGRAYKNIISSKLAYEDAKEEVLSKFKREINKTNQQFFELSEKEELNNRYNSVARIAPENVVLVIDELNRGNSAAIFGTVFQLLDRAQDGWSEYHITISELETIGLLKEIGFSKYYLYEGGRTEEKFKFEGKECSVKEYNDYLSLIFEDLEDIKKVSLVENKIKIPANLSILSTMNTSDNSIYFMDNAFKRRWDWEFVNIEDDNQRNVVASRRIKLYDVDKCAWNEFVDQLNYFIRYHYKTVRKIEDKQIGYFFINDQEINHEHIKNKLMFFLWDSVFNTNRKPLTDLLEIDERELVTFGQFTKQEVVKEFVQKILGFHV
ncbi:hypothetical protein [Haliscomenobacter hydrossis]|uniref:Restriction enzyme LlaI protein n=1 Tax=Haliscomenobacter hydrossis (strain ATCC 27775 / DSM 1100 / LMG 10767 / O) TaxID=760192 RepID=F4L5B6_HALH1|nr:hypothetical protein [Haliscomenobacter hydrossis]AEE49796.1 restriction enzyme LlaI protein [Haliscomenobacter hydrossis DSM 1100]